MVKKLFTVMAAALAAVVISGCSTVETAGTGSFNGQRVAPGRAVAHISAATHGLYFLWFPLITGSTAKVGLPTFLEDTVNPAALSNLVTAESKKMNCGNVADLTTASGSFGLLFNYRHAVASGTAVK